MAISEKINGGEIRENKENNREINGINQQ